MLSSTASLQNLCLCKVVEQFEYYPHKLLACLPPTLRRLLLVHLPIIDICQLADTCVFDGIDTEAIWEQIYQQQIPRYFESLEGFPVCGELVAAKKTLDEKYAAFQEQYVSILADIILNRVRPSGYFVAQRDYGGFMFEIPPPSILDKAPVDIVNTIIAGEKLEIVQTCSESLESDTFLESDEKERDPSGEDAEPDLEEEYAKGDTIITAVSDYDNEYQDRYLENHCDHERGEHFMEISTYKETNQRYQYIPPRYSSYANNNNNYRLSDEDAITLLTDKCGYLPKHMFVSVTAFNSKQWSLDLLRKFLSGLVSLKLCIDDYVDGMKETEELLTAVLSNPKPALSSLVLHSFPDLDCCCDEEGCLVTDDHLLVLAELSEIPSTLPPPVSPLCTLSELSLYGRFTTSGLNDLGTIISSQQCLASFSLRSFLPGANCYEYKYIYDDHEFCDYRMSKICLCTQLFVGVLISFFESPSFQSVRLTNVAFPQKLLQSLLAGFLRSSCTHAQVLKCEGIVLIDEGDVSSESPQKAFPLPELAFQYKFLEVSIREFENSSSLLFSVLPLQLNSLTFSCYDHLYRRSHMNPNKYHAHNDCLPIVAMNANFQVKSLSLCQPAGISTEAVQALLKNQELKCLELNLCRGVMDFTDIADCLLKQLPAKSAMEEIKIKEGASKENQYYPTTPFSQESVKFFSDTLFSLPILNQLTFEISLDYRVGRNYPEFVKLMYESWKKNSGGRKLKKFVLHISFLGLGPEVQESIQMAGEMGLHVDSNPLELY